MTESRQLTPEELEKQRGEELPAREVMSVINTDPSCIVLPPDGYPVDDPFTDVKNPPVES